ncbi:MAG: hypothetical protein ACE5DK_06205, partial [Paracoccaceae bacterium]
MAARKKRKPGRGRSTRGASGLFARFLRIVSAVTTALTLSGCLSSDPTKHDRLELENISVANI